MMTKTQESLVFVASLIASALEKSLVKQDQCDIIVDLITEAAKFAGTNIEKWRVKEMIVDSDLQSSSALANSGIIPLCEEGVNKVFGLFVNEELQEEDCPEVAVALLGIFYFANVKIVNNDSAVC